jgi:SP family sugar:H+ symporter-like MFS transporter
MKLPFFNKQGDGQPSPPSTDIAGEADHEKRRSSSFDESPVPWVTWRSLTLGAFVSIGGVIFGYDTGQISGFLEMNDYKHRYGQQQSDGTFYFSNVRSGLIVSLVSGILASRSFFPRGQPLSNHICL